MLLAILFWLIAVVGYNQKLVGPLVVGFSTLLLGPLVGIILLIVWGIFVDSGGL